MSKNLKQIALWGLSFLLLLLVYQKMQHATVQEKELPYSEFKAKVQAGVVTDVIVKPDLLKGSYKDGANAVAFHTIPVADAKLVEDMEKGGVKFAAEADKSWITTALLNVGWIALFFFVWWFLLIRPAQGGGKQAMSFGRSRARLQDNTKNKVTFADVAGCDETKEELKDIVDFLKDPKKFQRLGGELPKGVLLFGPPGTGKTLLARAVAGEAGVPFFTSSGSEFVEMFVGVGASRVRDLFEQAKKAAPAILFVDELDAVGRHRFAGIGGGHDEREQTLNQLLVELDGFESKQGIILIGATNRPDVLDPALLRPGRFDRHINVPIPDIKGRQEILKVHAKKVKASENVDMGVLARRTPGFVGADLANIVNEAALIAARKDKESVEMIDLEDAVEKSIAGPERKSRVISDREKKIIACHESGHALIAKLIPGCDPVHKVSIIPRGPALGYTLQLPVEDKYLTTRTELVNRLCVLLGGRAAEEIVFGELTTGAHDDLSKATLFAQKMVTEFGMSEKLGPVSHKRDEGEVFLGRDIVRRHEYSEQTARSIDEEVSALIRSCHARAKELLATHKDKLNALAGRLMEKEVLSADEIEAVVNPDAVKPAEPAKPVEPMFKPAPAASPAPILNPGEASA